MVRHMPKVLSLAFALSLFGPSLASACDEGERLRVTEDMSRLAGRNAWSGVERSYETLGSLKCPLKYENYFLGAQAARVLGKTFQVYERLDAARAIEPKADILAEIESIDLSFGRVQINGDARKRPVLIREEMPFSPDERKSVEYAQEVVAGTGSFKGMLPFGDYIVGGQEFTVEAGPAFLVIEVGKVKGPKPPPGSPGMATTQTQGAINYAHLVATVGAGFASTPAPGNPVADDIGRHQFHADSFSAAGISVQIGGEVGLTYKKPEAGVALTAGYTRGGGNDSINVFSGWLAGVLRPGDLRVALGPTYNITTAQGIGVADWFMGVDQNGVGPQRLTGRDIGPQRSTTRYRALSGGIGAQASVGYGLVDLDPFKGVVEVGGAWHRDDARSYYTVGLRLGIVPKVPRFEG